MQPNSLTIPINETPSYDNLASAEAKDATSDTKSNALDQEMGRLGEVPPFVLETQASEFLPNRPDEYYTSCPPESSHVLPRSDSMGSLNHPVSRVSNIKRMSMSSQRSVCSSIGSYRDNIRSILRRGSRTSSCISEVVSLLGRFSFHESRASICDSIDQTPTQQNESAFPENPDFQSIPEPQIPDFDIFSHPNTTSGVLEQHMETVRRHNSALLTTCHGCSETKDCVHGKIMGATLSVTKPSTTLPSILSMGKTACDYAGTDCYGNNLLFFAARVAAPLFVLLEIIQNTADLNALNNDGQNFLFVLDPHRSDGHTYQDSEFSTLISCLEQRQFNFDHLDHNGRSFLVFLCLRPCFRMSWITLLCQRSQAWQRRIETLAQQKDSAGAYLAGYLTGNSDFQFLHPYVLSIVSNPKSLNGTSPDGRNVLHDQVVQHLITYATEYPEQQPTELPMYPYHWDGCNINGYDNEGYTPLGLFMKEVGRYSWISRHFVVSQMKELIKLGADINSRYRNGDTLLHMAARNCDFPVMEFLASSGIHINHQNNEGLRAIDCFGSTITKPAGVLIGEGSDSFVRTLQCVFLLINHGSTPYSMLCWY
jgi:hypothetical protein